MLIQQNGRNEQWSVAPQDADDAVASASEKSDDDDDDEDTEELRAGIERTVGDYRKIIRTS